MEVIVQAELATAFLCPGCVFDYIRNYFFMLMSAIVSTGEQESFIQHGKEHTTIK